MGQGHENKDESDTQNSSSNTVVEKKRDQKDHTPSKVVIRRLPPTLTPEDFLQLVSPLPDYDFFYFVRADMSLGPNSFTRAYINFMSPDDIFIFRDKFDGYVFLDAKGGEYPAIVEFAPFQKVPKKKPKKVDAKNGLIEQDSDYKKFLDNLSKPVEAAPVSLDAMVVEVESKENSQAKSGSAKVSTPLLDYLRKRREERKLNIAKLKEERRRGGGRDRDMDRKRSGKEEMDKRKSASEKDRVRDRDRRRERNRDRLRDRDKDRKRERDAQRSEKQKEEKGGDKRWQKDGEGTPRQTVMLLRNTDRESQSSEKGNQGKPPQRAEREKREEGRDTVPETVSENELGKGGRDRRRDDKRGKRGGKWDEERNKPPGGKERGSGNDERDKPGGDKGARSYREEDRKRNRQMEERGGGDRYTGKDRGEGNTIGRDEKVVEGGRDKFRDDRGGRNERKGAGGDGWRKREGDADRKKVEKEQPYDRRSEAAKYKRKEDGKKEREGQQTNSGKESQSETSKEDKEKQKDEESSVRSSESAVQKSSRFKGETDSQSQRETSDPSFFASKQAREDDGERGASTDGDEKKRKRKDRPERQIYIPRRALEKQRQGSPQTGKGRDEKTPEPT